MWKEWLWNAVGHCSVLMFATFLLFTLNEGKTLHVATNFQSTLLTKGGHFGLLIRRIMKSS
jgi:hypothetical protein